MIILKKVILFVVHPRKKAWHSPVLRSSTFRSVLHCQGLNEKTNKQTRVSIVNKLSEKKLTRWQVSFSDHFWLKINALLSPIVF